MGSFNLDNAAVQAYMVYSGILALKVILMAPMTAITRIYRGSFANPEDAKMFRRGQQKLDDPLVERIRRAHLNDLENIPVFWLLGALYLTTGPSITWATILFRIFAACRIIHSIVYAVVPIQPIRAIVFAICSLINAYLGFQVVLYYITAI